MGEVREGVYLDMAMMLEQMQMVRDDASERPLGQR